MNARTPAIDRHDTIFIYVFSLFIYFIFGDCRFFPVRRDIHETPDVSPTR